MRALFLIEMNLWAFEIYSDGFVIIWPLKFSYRTVLLLMKFLLIRSVKVTDRYDKSFYWSYLTWYMVNVDTTFLYINSIVVPDLGGRSIGCSWSTKLLFLVYTSLLSLFFFLIAWDFIAIQKVFDIDKLRELGKIVIFELGSHFCYS